MSEITAPSLAVLKISVMVLLSQFSSHFLILMSCLENMWHIVLQRVEMIRHVHVIFPMCVDSGYVICIIRDVVKNVKQWYRNARTNCYAAGMYLRTHFAAMIFHGVQSDL